MARSPSSAAADAAIRNGSATLAFLRRYGVWLIAAVIAFVLPIDIGQLAFEIPLVGTIDFGRWILPGGAARTVLSQIGVAIVFALAFNMLLGQGGMLSFGHAIYFGLAGFCVVHIIEAMSDDPWITIPISLLPLIGGLVGLLFGIAVGYVSTRRAGTIFAMISLGFGELVSAMVLIVVAFFGGEEGIQTNRAYESEFFGLVDWTKDIHVYYLIAFWGLLAIAAMYAITKTPLGRMSNAVRDNPERVAFVGYNTQRVRWFVFAISGFFAGLAGALHSISFEQAGFEMVGLERSGAVLFMAYIGGAGHFAGPVIGAVTITGLEKLITDVSKAWPVYIGLFFMAVVMFSRGGIAGVIQIHERIWRIEWRLMKTLARPYAKAVGSTIVAIIGAIGIVELTHAVTSEEASSTAITLFWMHFDAASALPWLISVAIGGTGIYLCRRTYAGAKDSYGEAMKQATEKVLG